MLSNNIFKFLSLLEAHNHREWFEENRSLYLQAKTDFEQYVQALLQANTNLIPGIESIPAKDCIFRIFKDVRFSKDKTPYKTNFGAAISALGRKVHGAGFYLHIQPGNRSFVGGGVWMPEKEHLKAIRQEIDYQYNDFCKLLKDKKFVQYYGDLDRSEQLKKCPKGYEESHPAIAYLKLKSFTASHLLSDEQLTAKNSILQISKAMEALNPLIQFLNEAMQS